MTMTVPMREPATRNKEYTPEVCASVHEILARIGDKWTVAIVTALGDRRMRFKILHRSVGGVSQRVLTTCLRNLERDGLMVRTAYLTVPPSVEYELSERGRSLRDTLEPIAVWVQAHWQAIEQSRRRFDFETQKPSTSIVPAEGGR